MTKLAPQISVIIPAYNAADTIMDSINSVFAQTFENYELIIINDASPDNMSEVLKSITDPRLKILDHQENKGASAARNTGILAAQGNYVAFLDSDDIWYPKKLEEQHKIMKNSAVDVKASCTSFVMCRTNGRKNTRILEASKNWNKIMLDGCTVSPGSTMMVEKNIFSENKIGLYNTKLKRLEDWDWLLSYCNSYKLGIIEDVLTEVRISGYPNYEIAKNAADKLWNIKQEFIQDNYGAGARNVFKAGLEIENATTAFRNKLFISSIKHLVSAFSASPKRAAILFLRIIQKLKNLDFSVG
ncbi:MAG: glycosyltransferase family 2 protein [Bdellovibrionales bacterium]